jgi:CRP/FNR family cyclic AMP-dependent transcriptional regulator
MFFQKEQAIYRQGDASDAVFVVQTGLVTLSARPQGAKETSRQAVIDIFGEMDFVGKCSISGESLRPASARALTDCWLVRIEKTTMMDALARELTLSNLLCASLLARNTRHQLDLVDQRCNYSEGRLARVLLRIAQLDAKSSPQTKVERISHKILAEMIGTTRSRVCAFMNKFEAAGLIEYEFKKHRMRVSDSLLEALSDSRRSYT